jgi:hypothetical protein
MDDHIEPQTSGAAEGEATPEVPPPRSDAIPAAPEVPNMGWLTTPGDELLRWRRPNLAALQDGFGPWVPRPPPAMPTWPPDSEGGNTAAQIAASRRSLNPALGAVGEVLPPLTLRVLMANAGTLITRQEQPDHPQSLTSPGVQDQPTAPPTPAAEIAAANYERIQEGLRTAALFNLGLVGEGALQAEALVVPDQSPAPVRVEEHNGKISVRR